MEYATLAVVGIIVSLGIESWLRARPTRQDATPYTRETHRCRTIRRTCRAGLCTRLANRIAASGQRLRRARTPLSPAP